MYNSGRGYVSAIDELWSHQTSQGLYQDPEPHWAAIKALKTSLVRGKHTRQRKEYTGRGVGTIGGVGIFNVRYPVLHIRSGP